MKKLTVEEREILKKNALETIKMVDNYPKKFDVTVCVWAEGLNKTEAINEVENQLRQIRFPATISSCEEVNDY